MRRLAVLLVALGCGGIGFDIPYAIPEQTVQGDPIAHAAGTLLAGAPINPFNLNIDLQQEEQAHQVNGISHVTLSSLGFSITNGSGCFDFVKDVTISVESTKSGTALPPAVIATGSNPGCVQTFDLQPTSVDLEPYIDEGASVTSSGHGVPPSSNVTFDGNLVLHASL